MERDDETGFAYHGARYYAPWLCRWISGDPNGSQSGPNLYEYCRGSPVVKTDRNGRSPDSDRLASVNRFLDENRDKVLTTTEVLSGFEDVKMTANEWSILMRQYNGAGYSHDFGVDALIDDSFPAMSAAMQNARVAASAEYGVQQDAEGDQYSRADRREANAKDLNRHRNPQRLITMAVVAAMVLFPEAAAAFNAGIKIGEAANGRRSGARLEDLLVGNYGVAGKTMSKWERVGAVIDAGLDVGGVALERLPRKVKVGQKFIDDVAKSARRPSAPENLESISHGLRKLQRRVEGDSASLGLFNEIPLNESAANDLIYNIMENAVTQRNGRLKMSGYAGERGIAFFDEFGRGVLVRKKDAHFITFIEEPRGLKGVFR